MDELLTGRQEVIIAFERGIFSTRHIGAIDDEDDDDNYMNLDTLIIVKKHDILKKLKQNTDIIICRPDKGNGVVILYRTFYISSKKKMLNDQKKF